LVYLVKQLAVAKALDICIYIYILKKKTKRVMKKKYKKN